MRHDISAARRPKAPSRCRKREWKLIRRSPSNWKRFGKEDEAAHAEERPHFYIVDPASRFRSGWRAPVCIFIRSKYIRARQPRVRELDYVETRHQFGAIR